MALADPQSVSYDGTAYNLPRVSSAVNAGAFYKNIGDGNDLRLSISHSYGKRTRRLARLDVGLVSPNPFATGLSSYEKSSYYLVVDTPATNGVIDPAVAFLGGSALLAWLTASSNSKLTNLLEGQN